MMAGPLLEGMTLQTCLSTRLLLPLHSLLPPGVRRPEIAALDDCHVQEMLGHIRVLSKAS